MPKNFFIFLIIFLIIFGFLIFNFRKTEKVEAGSGDNVYGWAWSENIGWISFNRINCDANNDGLSDGIPAGCPVAGTSIPNYGVNIDSVTGNFSGYAWSENIGWIRFNPPGPYPNCPVTTCPDGSPNYPARLNLTTRKITGWARACAGTVNGDCNSATRTDGWDGWILLGPIVKGGTDYGALIESGVPPNEFRGWAWGSDVVGWISFNCEDTGACSDSDYKVMTSLVLNSPPYIEPGSQTRSEFYCNVFAGQGRVDFQWKYKDPDLDPETRFDFRVNDVNDVNDLNPEVDRSFSGFNNPDGTINSQVVLVISPLEADKITFNNTTYYWWVRVWDNQGKDSGWVPGPSFTTPLHAYPWIDFSWLPLSPSVGVIVTFTDQSLVFGGATKSSWDWTFQDGDPASSDLPGPQTKFTSSGPKEVSLTVTDSDTFVCTDTKTVNTSISLPEWKEIRPF